MAAWFSDLTSRAEQLITNLDNSTAEVLNNSKNTEILSKTKSNFDQDLIENTFNVQLQQANTNIESALVITEKPKDLFKKKNTPKLAKVRTAEIPLSDDVLQSEIKLLQEEIYHLRESSSTLQQELNKAYAKIEKLSFDLTKKESEITDLNNNESEIQILKKQKIYDNSLINDLQERLSTLGKSNESLTEKLIQSEQNCKSIESELQDKLNHSNDSLTLINEKVSQLTKEITENRVKYLSIIKSKDEQIENLINNSNISTKQEEEETGFSPSRENNQTNEKISSLTLEVQRFHDQNVQLQLQLGQSQSKIFDLQNSYNLAVRNEEFCKSEIDRLNNKLMSIQNDISLEKQNLLTEYDRLSEENENLKRSLCQLEQTQMVDKNRISSQSSPIPDANFDAERIKLEAKIRELNEKIFQNLNSESALLTENQALRIQLQNMKEKNVEEFQKNINSFTSDRVTNQYQQMRISTGMTFVRLDTQTDSSIPKECYPILEKADAYIIYLGNMMRRRPMLRLLFFLYILILNFWFCFSSILFTPHINSDFAVTDRGPN